MRDHSYSVYIMTNRSRTLYVGMTNNLPRRVRQHKEQLNEGSFTSRYKLDRIVWFEQYKYVRNAIAREKQIKRMVADTQTATDRGAKPDVERPE